MKRLERDFDDDDDDDEDDISYGDIFVCNDNNNHNDDNEDNIGFDLPEGVDCEQTRADYQLTEKKQGLKLIATFAALDLWVEHQEPLKKDEFCFAERIVKNQEEGDIQTSFLNQVEEDNDTILPTFHI